MTQGATVDKPSFEDDLVTLYLGDCLQVLRSIPDCSVDAVVTDPPYGLSFMGNAWDRPRLDSACMECGNDDPTEGYSVCTDCLEVVGDAARISDHGGKAMLGHVSKNWHEKGTHSRGYADQDNAAFQAWCQQWAAECLRTLRPGGHLLAFGGTRTWHRLAVAIEDAGFEVRDNLAWLYGSGFPKTNHALKPAFEPIVVARKPLTGTIAANVAQHGTGTLNIDSCRLPMSEADAAAINAKHAGMDPERYERPAGVSLNLSVKPMPLKAAEAHEDGRWPANVLLDADQATALDRQGEASRFFYVSKAPTSERPKAGEVAHPTVKPLDLMRWLVRLVTPHGGTVLEPFAGSGTTAEACSIEGFRCIAIEREADYIPLIVQRLTKPIQPSLFGGAA